MGNNQYRLVLVDFAEVVLQPLNGVEVEVVGRLIEQQVLRLSEEGFCQHDAHFLRIRQFRHLLLVQVLLDTEVLQQLCRIALSLPSVHLGELQLEVGGTVAVRLAHLRFGVKFFTLLHVLPERLVAHEDGIHYLIPVIFEVVLLQYRQPFARPQFHGSLVGLQVAGDGPEQRRLSGTVGTDDSVDVARCKLHVDVLVENPLAELDGKV